jgi:hypothetical protein
MGWFTANGWSWSSHSLLSMFSLFKNSSIANVLHLSCFFPKEYSNWFSHRIVFHLKISIRPCSVQRLSSNGVVGRTRRSFQSRTEDRSKVSRFSTQCVVHTRYRPTWSTNGKNMHILNSTVEFSRPLARRPLTLPRVAFPISDYGSYTRRDCFRGSPLLLVILDIRSIWLIWLFLLFGILFENKHHRNKARQFYPSHCQCEVNYCSRFQMDIAGTE